MFGLAHHINKIRDERKKRSIKTGVVGYILVFAFVFQISSFNRLKYFMEENKKRFQNILPKGTRIPKIDAVRDIVKSMELSDVQDLQDSVVSKAIENKILRENTINGLRVAAVDGVELFASKVKSCDGCLTRELANGETEYFHKAVVCMTVGSDPHIVLGAEMLSPKNDGSDKDEGELTGVKRLLKRLNKTHYHFADVIVGDALFMNAPFINLVKGIGKDVVIRAKDKRLNIVKDALGLFSKRPPDEIFNDTKKTVYVWDDDNFYMEGCKENIRFLRFVEEWITPKGKKMTREAWCVTTLPKGISAHTVWLIMRKRWDIENNGFRMLKTYFNADHNYVHGKEANEKILLFILTAFNLLELFLFRRLKDFRKRKLLRINILSTMFDELLAHNMSSYFYTVPDG